MDFEAIIGFVGLHRTRRRSTIPSRTSSTNTIIGIHSPAIAGRNYFSYKHEYIPSGEL